MESLKNAKSILIEALFPRLCASCKKEIERDELLCKLCTISLTPHFVMERYFAATLFSVSFLFSYKNSPMRGILHALKYNYITDLAPLIWQVLEKERATLKRLRADLIIPLPLHTRRLRARGFNQSELIAAKLGEILSIPLSPQALKRRKNTPFQIKAKSRASRARNVKGAFEVTQRDAVRGKHILLVDDVITTGATLTEAARVLRDAGAKKVTAFVLAKD